MYTVLPFFQHWLDLRGINLWWCFVTSSNISLLDQCYLTVRAEMTDSPSGASASQIRVVPKVPFPDVGPAEGGWLWSKTQEACICLAKKHDKLFHAVQTDGGSRRRTTKPSSLYIHNAGDLTNTGFYSRVFKMILSFLNKKKKLELLV